MAVEQSPKEQNIVEAEELDQSLEVDNFLAALERVITRLFGSANSPNDNEDVSDGSCATQEEN